MVGTIVNIGKLHSQKQDVTPKFTTTKMLEYYKSFTLLYINEKCIILLNRDAINVF